MGKPGLGGTGKDFQFSALDVAFEYVDLSKPILLHQILHRQCKAIPSVFYGVDGYAVWLLRALEFELARPAPKGRRKECGAATIRSSVTLEETEVLGVGFDGNHARFWKMTGSPGSRVAQISPSVDDDPDASRGKVSPINLSYSRVNDLLHIASSRADPNGVLQRRDVPGRRAAHKWTRFVAAATTSADSLSI